MAVSPTVKSAITPKLELYEGRIRHMYLDTQGKVTIGVGCLVASKAAAAKLPLYTLVKGVPGAPATTAEKETEFATIAAMQKGQRPRAYEAKCLLAMKDADITKYREDHITEFHEKLTAIYTKAKGFPADFDALPEKVQQGLFDMIFNLGRDGLVTKFPSFNAALKISDWKKAAAESNRPQISDARNAYVRQLFLDTAAEAAKK